LSEELKYLIRNAHISIVVGAALLVVSLLFFSDNEGMLEVGGFTAFIGGLVLLLCLNRRSDRLHGERQNVRH
jgi:ABC-type Fe3+-siderophore transport system permease subunit